MPGASNPAEVPFFFFVNCPEAIRDFRNIRACRYSRARDTRNARSQKISGTVIIVTISPTGYTTPGSSTWRGLRMASGSGLLLAAALLLIFCPVRSEAETLKITSNPAGAKVELDGVLAGSTPFEKDFPGGYFHKPFMSVSPRLEHAMVARISLEGYATKELNLTEGPMNWISFNGHNHGEYWLLKSDHFQVDLQPISQVFTGGVSAKFTGAGNVDLQPELSLEELVRRTKPAVVYLKGLDKSGTGFFVTETGVIATNAHVARGEETLVTVLPGGEQLEAKVVYIDADLDIALAKVEGKDFPRLSLADAASVRQGENVVAIGNPGDAMLFSVTKGIVSAVGKFASAGPGTWIQTDTPINPGNSGGPLLNGRGEVIGINTQKLVKKNVTGIGFALSATDLLSVLRRFYPAVSVARSTAAESQAPNAAVTAPQNAGQVETVSGPGTDFPPVSSNSSPPTEAGNGPAEPVAVQVSHGFGIVTITSDPDGAEIFVDDKFAGNAPAKLKLPAGTHSVVLKVRDCADWKRSLEVYKDSQVSLKAELDPKSR
jgi:S1-C subfamily serine protease